VKTSAKAVRYDEVRASPAGRSIFISESDGSAHRQENCGHLFG
jgi:hypothetical protein